MTLMPEIHDALARAVAIRRRRRRRRFALATFGVLVVSGTAVAATSDWRPVLGSDEHPRPRAAKSEIPADQLAALGILRREQTEADRGPEVQAFLKLMSREHVNGLHTDGIRVVYRRNQHVVILYPAARVGDPRFKPSVQRHVLCLIATSGPGTGWGGTCGDVAQLRYRGLETGTTGRRVVVVPDGVARVEVRLRGRRWVKARVQDNVYTYKTDQPPASMGVRWFDADGKRIRHPKPRRMR